MRIMHSHSPVLPRPFLNISKPKTPLFPPGNPTWNEIQKNVELLFKLTSSHNDSVWSDKFDPKTMDDDCAWIIFSIYTLFYIYMYYCVHSRQTVTHYIIYYGFYNIWLALSTLIKKIIFVTTIINNGFYCVKNIYNDNNIVYGGPCVTHKAWILIIMMMIIIHYRMAR